MLLSVPLTAVEQVKADELDSLLDYLVTERETELNAEAEQQKQQRLEISRSEKAQSRARLADPSTEQQESLFKKAQESVFQTR